MISVLFALYNMACRLWQKSVRGYICLTGRLFCNNFQFTPSIADNLLEPNQIKQHQTTKSEPQP